MQHEEIPIKVNAWIDRGIVPLVAALNDLDGVMTLSSCEGSEDKQAHVYLCYYDSAEKTVALTYRLAVALHTHVGERVEYTLSVEWRNGNDQPMIILNLSPGGIPLVAEAVKKMACEEKENKQ